MPAHRAWRSASTPLHAAIGAIVATVISAGGATWAQVLRLDGAETQPPALEPSATAASALIDVLQAEVAQLVESSVEDPVTRALANVRVIAADLLAAGQEAGRDGSIATLMGVTLAGGRREIDGRLRGRGTDGATAGGSADIAPGDVVRLVERFNAVAARQGLGLGSVAARDLDEAVAALLAPLGEVIAALAGTRPVSHWPAAGLTEDDTLGEQRQAATSVPAIQTLRERARAVGLAQETRDEVERILKYLERGERFPELRPQVHELARLVAGALDLAAAIDAAAWLSGEARSECHRNLHGAIMLLGDRTTRDEGRQRLRHLDEARAIIERVTTLAASGVSNLMSLQAALRAVLASIEANAEGCAAQLRVLRGIAVDMDRYREISSTPVRGEFAPQYRELEQSHRQAQAALLDHLGTIIERPDALADPALASLVIEHHQHLEDLRRVDRMSDWAVTIGLIDAEAGPAFTTQARRMCRSLSDPTRRPEAIRAVDEFERQLALFYPLPFEREIGAGEELAILMTGGRHLEYLSAINAQRGRWARAWGEGQSSGAAVDAMFLRFRLNRTMADLAAVASATSDGALLNRWAAWEMDGQLVARLVAALPGRLKVATASAIDGDERGLEQQLERVEQDAPLARLAGRIAQALSAPLLESPVGDVGTLGQLLHPPAADGWLLEWRRELADVCRYAWEESHARSLGNGELAAALSRTVNEIAGALLVAIGERPPAWRGGG